MKLKRISAVLFSLWLALAAITLLILPAQAAVTAQTPYIAHTGNGTATTFAYPFRILKDTDLVVTVAGVQKALTTDYTVTGVGDSAGGTIVFGVAPASGLTIEIEREIPRDRSTDYQQAGPFFAKTVNADIDRLEMQVQELGMDYDRAIKVKTPAGSANDTIDADQYDIRAGKVFGYDVYGKLALLGVNLTTSSSDIANPWVDVRGYGSLAEAVAAIGGTVVELKVADVQILTSNLVVPENITIKIEPGGIIDPAGNTITIKSPFNAGDQQVFTLNGNVVGLKIARPEWWGGIPNGTTDCAHAFRAAAIAGKSVFISPSTAGYLVGSTVLVPSDTDIYGSGKTSLVKAKSTLGNNPVFRNTNLASSDGARDHSISFRDFAVDGNGTNNSTATEFSHCIQFRGVVDGLVANIYCIDPKGDGVAIDYGLDHGTSSERIKIIGNTIINYRRNGVSVTDAEVFTIANNHIDIVTHTTELHGIVIEENGPNSIVKHGDIYGNIVKNGGGGTSYAGITAGNAGTAGNFANLVIYNNIITNRVGNGITYRGITNLKISSNIIDTVSATGIEEIANGAGTAQIAIVDNVVKSPTGFGISCAYGTPYMLINNNRVIGGTIGIFVENGTGYTINSNVTSGQSVSGIFINAALVESAINNNVVKATVNGIRFLGASVNNTLTGNVLADNSNIGLVMSAISANNILAGNVYSNNTGGDVQDPGTDNNVRPVYAVRPTYVDNAAALVGGLVAGEEYKTATGVVMVVY